ncbi:MAG: SPOR domain-containing protein, partial [Alphaproteobacteria bacterium]|nr:SPOR domain-containing protein [Alphaproteobacteria bacterium]
GAYKQRPENPGGIDIPHQDVRVYDQLENKAAKVPEVEHLLPLPETPKEIPSTAIPPAVEPPVTQTVIVSVPAEPAAAPVAAPSSAPTDLLPKAAAEPPPVASAPAAKPAPAKVQKTQAEPAKPKKEEALSIEKIISDVGAKKEAAPAASAATGNYVVQLASSRDQVRAKAMVDSLSRKYASELGVAKLHLVRADLGSKGIYYRIQSDLLAKSEANRICSSLKKMNAGCILVGK